MIYSYRLRWNERGTTTEIKYIFPFSLVLPEIFIPSFKFYRRHHDSSEHKKNDAAGHRILTFFLYLNDVDDGGETRFTTLDIDVKPKKVCWDYLRCRSSLSDS